MDVPDPRIPPFSPDPNDPNWDTRNPNSSEIEAWEEQKKKEKEAAKNMGWPKGPGWTRGGLGLNLRLANYNYPAICNPGGTSIPNVPGTNTDPNTNNTSTNNGTNRPWATNPSNVVIRTNPNVINTNPTSTNRGTNGPIRGPR